MWLKGAGPNRVGIAAYEKPGLRHGGRLRNSGYRLGQPADELIMDALPEDLPGPSAVTAAVGA